MGKTFLKKKIIHTKVQSQPFLNVYHIDTKKRGDYSSHDGKMFLSEYAPPVFTTPGNKMVWQPLLDDKEQYSLFFTNILETGLPAIVDIDEAINMRFNGDTIPRGLSILLAQGRLPGISVFGGTQELARSPRQMLSQSTYIISFSLLNDYDERMMKHYLNLLKEDTLNLKKYSFYMRRPEHDVKAILFDSYEKFLPLVA